MQVIADLYKLKVHVYRYGSAPKFTINYDHTDYKEVKVCCDRDNHYQPLCRPGDQKVLQTTPGEGEEVMLQDHKKAYEESMKTRQFIIDDLMANFDCSKDDALKAYVKSDDKSCDGVMKYLQ
jgi:hypothetical protein